MIQDFLIWLVSGASLRVAVGLAVSRFTNHHLAIPHLLAGPIILGAALAKITFLLPVPLGLVIGLALPDALLVRQ